MASSPGSPQLLSSPPPAPFSPAAPSPMFITEITLGNTTYTIRAVIEDSEGNLLPLNPSEYNPQTMQHIQRYTHALLNSHNARYQSLNHRDLELLEVDSQGVLQRDRSLLSHNFHLPYDIAEQVASDRSYRRMSSRDLKAQDVWNRLNDAILNPERLHLPPPPPSPPHTSSSALRADPSPQQNSEPDLDPSQPTPPPSPTPPPPQPDDAPNPPQQNPPHANRPRPPRPLMSDRGLAVLPTQLQLRDHNFDAPDWYQTIPPRTRLRLLSNIWEPYRAGLHYTGSYPVERRIRDRFETIYNQLPPHQKERSSTAHEMLREYRRLKRECEQIHYTLPAETVEPAAQFLSRLAQRAPQQELRELIDRIPVDEEFFHYFIEQIEAEQILEEEIDHSQWAQEHYKEQIERFAFVLERYLDNH